MSSSSPTDNGAPAIRVVFFDVGGTILHVQPSVGEVYARAASSRGFDVDAGALEGRFRAAWKESLGRSRARSHTCSDSILREEWFRIVSDTFRGDVPDDALRPLFDELYELFVSPRAWTLVAGARETFERLRGRGLRLGILSNWDHRLRKTLEGLDLLPLFDFVVISHEIGYEKPHRAMFDAAVETCAEHASRILHVGDSLEADIVPARERGLHTLWVADAEQRAAAPQAGSAATSFATLSDEHWDELLR